MSRPIAVFDLDGTIADITHRLSLIEYPHKDWPAFFAACVNDKPIPGVIAWMRYMSQTHRIVILSGRSDEVELETIKWLQKHGVCYDRLLMRKAGDHRPDTTVKKEMIVSSAFPNGKVDFIVDDRPSMIAMWRGLGFSVYAVTGESWQ
jgi:phosphoglycolate phosphatase-like HAD superfamily hydrolase